MEASIYNLCELFIGIDGIQNGCKWRAGIEGGEWGTNPPTI